MEEDDDFGDLYGASEGNLNVSEAIDDDPAGVPAVQKHSPPLENEDDDHLYELSDEELLYGDSSASQPKETTIIDKAGVATANADVVPSAVQVADVKEEEESDEEDSLYRELYRPDDTPPPSARVETAATPARYLPAVEASDREKVKEELEDFPL